MLKQGMTIQEATERWVAEFNAIPGGMIEKLMRFDSDDWQEVTAPAIGVRVLVNKFPLAVAERYGRGEICQITNEKYIVKLDSGKEIECEADDFYVLHDDTLPMWGTMWSFGDCLDDDWLSGADGIHAMSNCGFRIYKSEEFGYFFGIDGAGYDFFDAHWIPLYRARGLEWHDSATEKEVREVI